MTNVVALAGGVGGAKLADGLAQILPPQDLTVIVNSGDDFDHLGLRICPDIDTVCYTLAGLANPETGWGLKDESWNMMERLAQLGGPSWFQLGDRDMATHLERTRRLKNGQTLSQVTNEFCKQWGVPARVLPMTDDRVETMVQNHEYGELPFQNYFVEHRCLLKVTGFRFAGIEKAEPAPGVLEAIDNAEFVVVCPSNPWVSIGPILSVHGIKEHLGLKPVIAISPIIQGKALKGPAAKIYAELGFEPSSLTVAQQYGSLLAGFVIDQTDSSLDGAIRRSGIIPYATNTIMVFPEDRRRLASEVMTFGERLIRRKK